MATKTQPIATAAVVLAALAWTSSATATERSAAVGWRQSTIMLGSARPGNESGLSGDPLDASELACEPKSARDVRCRPSQSSMANTFEADDQPTAVVRVDNLAAVRADDLRFAEKRAAAVFGAIGALVIWIDEDLAVRTGIRAPFTLVLMDAEKSAGQASLLVDALGFAEPQVRRAYVFHDRIHALNVRSPPSIPSILGDVMAHELGHLLLPPPGHSADGIMRPGVTITLRATDTFTKTQAREILSRLR